MKYKSQEEQLRELQGLSREKRRLGRDLLTLDNFVKGEWTQVGIWLCS